MACFHGFESQLLPSRRAAEKAARYLLDEDSTDLGSSTSGGEASCSSNETADDLQPLTRLQRFAPRRLRVTRPNFRSSLETIPGTPHEVESRLEVQPVASEVPRHACLLSTSLHAQGPAQSPKRRFRGAAAAAKRAGLPLKIQLSSERHLLFGRAPLDPSRPAKKRPVFSMEFRGEEETVLRNFDPSLPVKVRMPKYLAAMTSLTAPMPR